MLTPVVITAGPIYGAHPLGIAVLWLNWISLTNVEGYRVPGPGLLPWVTWLPCGKEDRRMDTGKSKAVET